MKAKKIYYKKLFNLGNYENEEIGIEIELDEGEKAAVALEKAREFVESKGDRGKIIADYNKAQMIIKFPEAHQYKEVKWAEEFLNKYDPNKDLPF